MAVYNVHGGHNKIVPGASSYLDEVTEDRKITAGVIALLKEEGNTVYDCTDDAGKTSGANLANIVAKCNAHTAALDISIHFNAAKKDTGDGKTKGVEVYVYSTSSAAYAAAERVCKNLAALGFTNRGVKVSTGLYVLKHTNAPAMLIETCFVDDKDDADLYNKVGVDAICKAITEGILNKTITITSAATTSPQVPGTAVNNNQLGYRAHCQSYGWLDPVRDGQTAGTTGKSKRMEALKIDVRKVGDGSAKLEVTAHIQGIGDRTYVIDKDTHDMVIGTVGQAKRIEAIAIKILEGLTRKHIKYRIHVDKLGWSEWKSDGEMVGSKGLSLGIQAIQIAIE